MTKTLAARPVFSLDSLAQKTWIALATQLAGVILTYLTQVLLARWMGETEYGVYAYVLSWVMLLAIPAGLGLPLIVLRSITQYRVWEDWGKIWGIIQASWLITILFSLVLALGESTVVFWINRTQAFVYGTTLLVGLWMVPLQALVKLQLEIARALESVLLSYGPSLILWPALTLVVSGLVFSHEHMLGSLSGILISDVTLSLVIALQIGIIGVRLQRECVSTTPEYDLWNWLKQSFPLLLQDAFLLILEQTDILMVGSIVGPEAAGFYGAAVKTALWVEIILTTVNVVAAPTFTVLYEAGDKAELQQVVFRIARWIFVPSLVMAIALIVFAQPVMSLFGAEFAVAHWQLRILVFGQLINACYGPVWYLMMMTGHQRKSLVVFGSSACLNAVLNAIAIPRYGATAAAVTTALTMILWNIWLGHLVIKHIAIYPSIFHNILGKMLGKKYAETIPPTDLS
ncbi:MAG: oligosaccharide flippase family protein [Nostoc sp. RI_552]|jgi:O-antigen/teichoic acid export membrane protein|uniref:lipopolysaccharide biosynthesis protein n=1 Tax=Umezakia ovalisporum TaxID=75695 RepID=UPI0026D28AF2|nr:oligosaccharide flippase family protein [Nostoc sp. RI_552]